MADTTEPSEPEPEPAETEPADAAEPAEADSPGAPPAGRPRSTVVLAAVAAVLLAFGVTMAVLYQHEASARAARDRAVAARDAQLGAFRAQLAQLQAQRADLQAKLQAAQDKQLDPAGYEQIKKCVQETAANEQVIAKILSDPNFATGNLPKGAVLAQVPANRSDFHAPTTCTDAVKFLK